MIPLDLILLGGVAVAFSGYVYGYVTGRCSKANPCRKCAFHTNEQRMERLEQERLRVEEAEKQAVLRHDYEHKGGAFLKGDPDKFNCSDEHCTRNKRVQP